MLQKIEHAVERPNREYVVFTGDNVHGVYSAADSEQALLASLRSQGYASLQEHVNDAYAHHYSQCLSVRGPLPLPADDIRIRYDVNGMIFRMGGEYHWLSLVIRKRTHICDDRYVVNRGFHLDRVALQFWLSEEDVARLILVPITQHLAEPIVPGDPFSPPRSYPGANVYLRDHQDLVG